MRKLYLFGLIGLAALIIGLAWADQMTFTTYYPAPYGVYRDMIVMDKLGVGTTAPVYPLDVAGNTIRLRGGSGGAAAFHLENTAAAGRRYSINSDNLGYFFIRDIDASDAVRMLINSIGNVGIGTREPDKPLHIFSNVVNPLKVTIDADDTSSVMGGLLIERLTTGIAQDGIGTGVKFWLENPSGAMLSAGSLEVELPSASSNSTDMVFRTMKSGAGDTEHMRIKSDGIINMPSQSACRVYIGDATDQSIPPGVWTKINFKYKDFDTQNEFDLSSDRFTATEDGIYLVSAQALMSVDHTDGRYYVSIYKNGDHYQDRWNGIRASGSGQQQGNNAIALVQLSTGDYIEMYVYQNDGLTRTVRCTINNTNLAICKLN